MKCSLIWVSKLQIQIALSTMESEYNALFRSMRDFIEIRGVIQEINDNVFNKTLEESSARTHSRTFAKIPQSVVYEDNSACLQFATMSKMSSKKHFYSIPFFISKVKSLEIKVVSVGTNNQKFDQFTKGFSEPKYTNDRDSLIGW